MTQNLIALLPMKGHSERVPNKNMKLFAGAPLYHAIVKTLLASNSVSKVVINTDCPIIKNDALANFERVEIIERPEAICGDFVSMNEVIDYDLSHTTGEHYIQTHSTNPLLSLNTLNNAIKTYFEKNNAYDSVFSVTELHNRFYWANGKPVNHNPEELIRTQDLPAIYEENSNFYIFSKKSFASGGKKRIGLKPLMFPMNKLEAIDIDYPEDFVLAETMYKIKNKIN